MVLDINATAPYALAPLPRRAWQRSAPENNHPQKRRPHPHQCSLSPAPWPSQQWPTAKLEPFETLQAPQCPVSQSGYGSCERFGRGCIYLYYIHISRQPTYLRRRPFEKQLITNFDHHIIQLPRNILISSVQRQRINTIPSSQAQRAKRTANHPATGSDQHLDR